MTSPVGEVSDEAANMNQIQNGINEEDREYTPNVKMIRNQKIRIIRGICPREVRKELMTGVRNGFLARLRKDRLKPEIFCHPAHLDEAREIQIKEALDAIACIAKVMI